MRAILQRFLHRQRERNAVAALTEEELDDLGLSRDRALRLASMSPDVPQRVAGMAGLFGVSGADLQRDRDTWLEMLETCEDCTKLDACRRLRLLEDFATAEQAGFCPNRATLMQRASTV